MTLLIVDDSANMRGLIRNIFGSFFEKIFECDDGSQALESYILNKPDWVFMDIKMKLMNGIRATKEITKIYPDAKILILTDFNDDDFKIAAKKNGASHYVLKENLNEIFCILNK